MAEPRAKAFNYAVGMFGTSIPINMLKTFQRKDAGKRQPQWTMPAGRYALVDAKGVWRFYSIDKPEQGRWAGYTFIKRLIARGGGDYEKLPIAEADLRNTLLQRIENDPKQAMTDYGHQSGNCGSCGRALSNEESLALGIGPICAGKMEW